MSDGSCCSIGAATAVATCSAVAPMYWVTIWTLGGVMFGYVFTGRLPMENAPSNKITMEITIAKIGRLTKKYWTC